MTTPHRTLQMALDALAEYTHDEDTGRCHGCGKKIGGAHHPPCPVDAAITALREALAAPPAAPAVPLTDEQIDELWRAPMSADWEHREFARAIEKAHGIGGGNG